MFNLKTEETSIKKIELALMALIEVKPFEEITITDITKRAGVSRMAYYRNFQTKQDIIKKYFEEAGKTTAALLKHESISNIQHFFEALFACLSEYNDMALIAFRSGHGDTILESFNKYIMVNENFDSYNRFFYCGAIYNVFRKWILCGKKETIREVAHFCASLTFIRGENK